MTDSELYQDRILDHYQQPFHRGPCPNATHCHEAINLPCGDQIRMELRVDGTGKIEDLFFQGEGCCVSQAAASMLVEHCQGHTIEELRQFGPADMLSLFGAPLTTMRRNCCLLPWRALQTAIAYSNSANPETSTRMSR